MHSTEYYHHQISRDKQRALVDYLCSIQAPWVFDMHVSFVNFSEHHCAMPSYINIMREPLQRTMSGYYQDVRNHTRHNISFQEYVEKEGLKNYKAGQICRTFVAMKKRAPMTLKRHFLKQKLTLRNTTKLLVSWKI